MTSLRLSLSLSLNILPCILEQIKGNRSRITYDLMPIFIRPFYANIDHRMPDEQNTR